MNPDFIPDSDTTPRLKNLRLVQHLAGVWVSANIAMIRRVRQGESEGWAMWTYPVGGTLHDATDDGGRPPAAPTPALKATEKRKGKGKKGG